jgi:hypothetical protein
LAVTQACVVDGSSFEPGHGADIDQHHDTTTSNHSRIWWQCFSQDSGELGSPPKRWWFVHGSGSKQGIPLVILTDSCGWQECALLSC